MASIEFGILSDWSTISLIPEYRVDLDEQHFLEIRPILDRITQRTGIEFDLYSSASVEDSALDVFIEELSARSEASNNEQIARLLICAGRRARELGKPLLYRGL